METNYQKAKRKLIGHAAIAGFELPEDGFILRMLKLAATPAAINENDLSHSVISRLFPNVRSSKEQKSRRNRQCLLCGEKIQKSEKYINHQVRYDKTILTIYLHKDCSNGL